MRMTMAWAYKRGYAEKAEKAKAEKEAKKAAKKEALAKAKAEAEKKALQAKAALTDYSTLSEVEFMARAKSVSIAVVDSLMNLGYVTFGYYKKDGTFRIFRATKCISLIPYKEIPTKFVEHTNMRFYDYIGRGWRSVSNNTQKVWLIVDQKPY